MEKNSDKIILDLCGGTGAWSRPYADAGYDVRVITLPTYDVREVFYRGTGDLVFPSNQSGKFTTAKVSKIYGILAAPPCTMFSLARTKAKKPRDLREGMETVIACLKIIWEIRYGNKLKFWALENPMGYLRQFLGNPIYTFDPSQFGDSYNKTTDLWGYFQPPRRKKKKGYFDETKDNTRKLPEIPEEYKKDHKMTDIQIKRSITPPRFAQAFFEANQ